MTTLQEIQATRKPMSLEDGKRIFGDDIIDPNTVSLYTYESPEAAGYIECLADGTYLCVVSNSSIHDADLTKVEQFLFDTWFDTYRF